MLLIFWIKKCANIAARWGKLTSIFSWSQTGEALWPIISRNDSVSQYHRGQSNDCCWRRCRWQSPDTLLILQNTMKHLTYPIFLGLSKRSKIIISLLSWICSSEQPYSPTGLVIPNSMNSILPFSVSSKPFSDTEQVEIIRLFFIFSHHCHHE